MKWGNSEAEEYLEDASVKSEQLQAALRRTGITNPEVKEMVEAIILDLKRLRKWI